MFNVCGDAVVRDWLHQTLGEEVTRNGHGDCVAEILFAFYVDDGLIASQDPVWLQESFNVLIRLFEQISLFTNAAKTKAMVCVSGQIIEGKTEEEYYAYKSQTGQPTTSVVGWSVNFAAPALRLDPIVVT